MSNREAAAASERPLPMELMGRVLAALECGLLWAEQSESEGRMRRTTDEFRAWLIKSTTDTPAAAPITAEREAMAESFYQHIAHGDDAHRAWLRRETFAWFARLSAPVAAQPAASGLSKFVHADDATRERIGEVVAERAFAAQEAAASGVDALLGDELMLALAGSSGATTYANRHFPGKASVLFGKVSWKRFCEALRAHMSTALTGAAKEVK